MRLNTEEDIKLAREGFEALSAARLSEPRQATKQKRIKEGQIRGNSSTKATRSKVPDGDSAGTIHLTIGGEKKKELSLPRQAVEALIKVLGHLAKGREVTVTAEPVELTTQQAADFLHVSRPFLVGLLEKGELPFHKVGTHRRVKFSDLQAYKQSVDARRLGVLEELTKQAQELEMGY